MTSVVGGQIKILFVVISFELIAFGFDEIGKLKNKKEQNCFVYTLQHMCSTQDVNAGWHFTIKRDMLRRPLPKQKHICII